MIKFYFILFVDVLCQRRQKLYV